MKLKEAIYQGESLLTKQHIADARLNCECLLEHVLHIGRADLYTKLDEALTPPEEREFGVLLKRRLAHEPLDYILKQCYFYGIKYHIDPRALIPRPESELLIEEARVFAASYFPTGSLVGIADVGTGSGVLAITLARLFWGAKVYATDISPAALAVAEINCRRYGVSDRVSLLKGDLLEVLPEPVNIMVANLPYVRRGDIVGLMPEIREFEPLVALDGGEDGLDKVRRFLPQCRDKVTSPGIILLEVGLGQAQQVKTTAEGCFSSKSIIEIIPNLGGIERVVRILHSESST